MRRPGLRLFLDCKILASISLFLISFSFAFANSARGQESKTIRIACVGDSITVGARVEASTHSYPAQLQKLLGDKYEVRNFGIGGATLIKKGRPNVWSQVETIRKFKPDVVVVSLGTNDTVGGSRKNWESIDQFEEDYQELINTFAKFPQHPRIILCTPTAMVLETKGLSEKRLADLKVRKPRLQKLCLRVKQLAEKNVERRVFLLDLNSVLENHPEWLTERDGVHPNETGYREIAKTVAAKIVKVSKQPNIILFLVDDMGWQDTSVPFHEKKTPFNHRYHTPNMERLAAAGMKFTQAYACSVCSPTRVSLMTGLNAARHRVTNWTLRKNASNDRPHPKLQFPKWNVNGLSPKPGIERTVHANCLPSFLQKAGYRTIHVGKAHFGAIGTPGSNPKNIGFDINIGGHAAGGPGSYLGTQNFSAAWRKGDRVWDVPGLQPYHGKDVFLTEALTIEAIKAVDLAIDDRKPFFLYMSHYAVHVPFAKDKRFYQKYLDKGLNHTEAMYAAIVEGMDDSLGKILDHVDRRELTENTIVLFMSDNGGLSASGRGGKKHSHNFPLSSGKGSAHEGGVRVPMIVCWPGVTNKGSSCHQPVMIEDFFPTVLEMASVDEFEQVGGRIDGKSFVKLLRGKKDQTREERPLVWHFPNHWGPKGPGIGPSSSLRLGKWKLIYYHDSLTYELFDLESDLGEQKNVASQKESVRSIMAEVLASELRSLGAQMPIDKSTGKPVPYPIGIQKQHDRNVRDGNDRSVLQR